MECSASAEYLKIVYPWYTFGIGIESTKYNIGGDFYRLYFFVIL